MRFRLTYTGDESVSNSNSSLKIKELAFSKLFEMGPPAELGWAMFKRINRWDGKHTVLRHGNNAITLETIT